MSHFRTFTGDEPAGTVIVRLVSGEDGARAFIRQVSDPSDAAQESIEQSEQLAVEEALALAHNKAANIEGGAEIVIDLGPEAEWDERWGRLA